MGIQKAISPYQDQPCQYSCLQNPLIVYLLPYVNLEDREKHP